MPTARAASMSAGSIVDRPTTVFLRIGKMLYRTKAKNAGRNPIFSTPRAPSSGTINASSARLGTV